MLTKKIREYEEIVRVINVNLKKNTSKSTEADTTTKYKQKEIEKFKLRFKILEDELHKREEVIHNLKSSLNKGEKDLKHKEEEVSKLITRRYDQVESGKYDKNKDYESQIEVLKEMIIGLKSQIKAKEMDGYRLEVKIVSLQSQIDAMRNEEKKLRSIVQRAKPSASNYSPALINKHITVSSGKTGRDKISRESTRPKPLIKSTPKVTKKFKKDIYDTLDNKSEASYKSSIKREGSKIQSSKPDILVGSKNKSNLEDDSDE